jgi:helicase
MRIDDHDAGTAPADPRPPFLWMKIADPDTELPPCPPETDIRVLLPLDRAFDELRQRLRARGVPVRDVPYLLEHEVIGNLDPQGQLLVTVGQRGSGSPASRPSRPMAGAAAEAARDGFDLMWHDHTAAQGIPDQPVPAERVVPTRWAGFLPHRMLNPAQAEAIPHIMGSDEHLIVVAPTGAGKTVIGMAAALRTIFEQGRKAAWLVPQRSLTDELNRELDDWRRRGLRVERLSGEYRVDIDRIRAADLWVTTTEKFEAICRTSSLRQALAEVGCLVVDEIHLLGDQGRGAYLEAILARVRGGASAIRIVGLSATVANAEQLGTWLDARTVRVAWRPTQLTWQLPTVANNGDWSLVEAAKARLTAAITSMVTIDEGSVLVFCGSKRNVRRTALIVAASRGANVFDVNPDDADAVFRTCQAVGVGLHYKGWEHKAEAENGFRTRKLAVLVATSTVAAGVNLPARAVVVQDTDVGLKTIDVATVQQMFGRAGRVGAGERRGWSFLLVTESERAIWQRKLLAGFRVNSQLRADLPEHLLAGAVQERIGSVDDSERWWTETLSYHQGNRDMAPQRQAIEFLIEGGFLDRTGKPDSGGLVPTELGALTARLMVSPDVCHRLRIALSHLAVPESPEDAEFLLIDTVARCVPKLAQAAISEDLKSVAVASMLARGAAGGPAEPVTAQSGSGAEAYRPGDLACAAMLAVANSPWAFRRHARWIGGLPYATMYPILEEAPRYLHWLACQGFLGTVHPWIAVVGADLGRRIRWRRCQAPRGSGRLLWMCEQMATSVHAEDVVPVLWQAATARGLTNPDWAETGRPQACQLGQSDYAALLRDRVTASTVGTADGRTTLTSPTAATLAVWSAATYTAASTVKGQVTVTEPPGDPDAGGWAVFTRRGDYQGTGWLAEYHQLVPAAARCDSPDGPAGSLALRDAGVS